MSTLRLLIPDWQGGNRPEYYLGAKLLAALVPKSKKQEQVEIKVAEPTTEVELENGIYSQSALVAQVKKAKEVLNKKAPAKVITLGGTCFISQAPFDYLHAKYQEKLGVIWLDAHPDVSTPKDFTNEHAMVLGNLLHAGDEKLAQQVETPLDPKSILYVGLQKLNAYEVERLAQLGIQYQDQTAGVLSLEAIQAWIAANGFTKLAIHFDVDVLTPTDFHSLYFAEPDVKAYSAAAGQMSFAQASEILKELSTQNEVVGLSIAEYLPWDALRLNQLFSQLDIFQADQ